MSDGDCAILLQQQACHRFANYIGAADDNGILTGEVFTQGFFDESEATKRCTGKRQLHQNAINRRVVI